MPVFADSGNPYGRARGPALGEQQDQGVRGPRPIGWAEPADGVADPEQLDGEMAALGQHGGGTIQDGRGWHLAGAPFD